MGIAPPIIAVPAIRRLLITITAMDIRFCRRGCSERRTYAMLVDMKRW